jgi:hypothetical protein
MTETRALRGAASHLLRREEGDPETASVARSAVTPPESADGSRRRARRLAWADLLRRVFAVDVLECPRCGGRMRLLATIHPPARRYRTSLSSGSAAYLPYPLARSRSCSQEAHGFFDAFLASPAWAGASRAPTSERVSRSACAA